MSSPYHSYFAKMQAIGRSLNLGVADFKSFLNLMPIGIIIHTADGRVAYLNEAAQTLLGQPPWEQLELAEFVSAAHLYLRGTDTPYPVASLPVTQALKGHPAWADDLESRCRDRPIVLQAQATPMRDDNDAITYAIVTLQDITARGRAHSAGGQAQPSADRSSSPTDHSPSSVAEIRLAALADALPGVAYSLRVSATGEMAFEYLHERASSFFEVPYGDIWQAPEQFLGGAPWRATLAHGGQDRPPLTHTWQTVTPAGSTRYLQTQAQPEVRDNGDICWHGLLLDVSDRHQAAQTIAEGNAILAALPDLIIKVDRAGYYTGRIRHSPEVDILPNDVDLVGCHISDYLPADLAAHQLAHVQAALATGERQIFEQALQRGDRCQYEEVRVVPCGPDEVLLIIRDISDRKATERALQENEAQHRAVISALPDLMFRVTTDGYWLDYVHTNSRVDCLPAGYDPIGHHITDHMPAAIAEVQLQKIQQAAASGTMQVFEQQLVFNGRVQHEEVRIVPYKANEVLFIIRDITQRKGTELALKQREAENQAILAAIPDLMFRLHRNGTYLSYFKEAKTEDLLDNAGNPIGRNIAEFATNDFLCAHIEKQMQAVHQVLETGAMQVYEQQVILGDRHQYEEVRIVPSGEDEVLVIIQNIDARKAAELALQQSEAQKQAILTAIPDLMFYMRHDGLILDYLGGIDFVDLFEDCEPIIGRNLREYATTPALAEHIEHKMQAMQQAIATGKMQIYEQEMPIHQTLQYEEVRVVPVNDEEVLVMIRDISERKRMEADLRAANERLEKLSLTDSLTNLANRRRLDEHLNREWRRALRDQQPLSFILFDLDYFKRFNDTYGHQIGDECLQQVAQAALGIVNRACDLVARYGGEEFAVVLSNTDLKGAFTIAQRIRENILHLNIPHRSSEVHKLVTASLGVSAIVPRSDTLPNVLIRQADQALYSAKQAGRNNCQCFIARREGDDL